MISKEDIHRMDLNYLRNAKRVDMSPEAITKRMYELAELIEISKKISIRYIYKYETGQHVELGLPEPVGETLS